VKRRYGRYGVETSNEEKVLFPDVGITKGDLIDYYEAVSEWMLPQLRRRALVMQRFPDGIEDAGFYQKQVADYFPEWIETTRVAKREDGRQELVVGSNRATLAYLANQACVTIHAWLSRCDRPEHPDQLVIDLDPPDDEFGAVRRAARRVRALLEDELSLQTFLKLTGSRGVHVVVPLDRSEDFESVRGFTREACDLLARRHPGELTTEQRVKKRRGRLYLDVGRNAYAQTAVAAYSVRARPGAPVVAPIAWTELGSRHARSFDLRNLRRRLSRREDPWSGMFRHARSLAGARERLRALAADDA
jgi:bifunctional non-homologous end joining protein LigD